MLSVLVKMMIMS